MENSELEKEARRLRNLKNFRNYPEEELLKVAEENLKIASVRIDDLFTDKDEKKLAKSQLKKYLEEYTIETTSDKNILRDVIYLEIINQRYKNKLNELYKEDSAVPLNLLNIIHKNQTQILELKKALGLTKEGEEATKSEAFKALELLEKKAEIWRSKNQASRELICIAKNTDILMSDYSIKKIENIKINDNIVGIVKVNKQGLKLVKQKILNVNRSLKNVLILKTNKGRKLICTPDHLIFSYLRSQNTDASGQDYFPAENCLRRKVSVLNYFDDLNNYYRGVLLGIILSDGWNFTPVDKQHPKWNFQTQFYISQSPKKELKSIEFILNYFKFECTKKFNNGGWGDGGYEFYIHTKHSNFIKDIKNELFLNKNIMIGFLAGFILGDGFVDKYGNANIIQKKEIKLLEQIFDKLKLDYHVNKNLLGNKISSYALAKQIPIVIPKSKKSEKYLNGLFGHGNHLPKEKITFLELLDEKQEVYDLTTETKNFIANGFIVHNCPYCGKVILLKIRTNIWEAQKHPFFQDRILGNEKLIRLYKIGRLSADEVAEVLETSSDYVKNWLLDKWKLRSSNKDSK